MKFTITIWFQNDERGKSCGLESIKLKTKSMTWEKAKPLAIKVAEKVWPHYEIEISKVIYWGF